MASCAASAVSGVDFHFADNRHMLSVWRSVLVLSEKSSGASVAVKGFR